MHNTMLLLLFTDREIMIKSQWNVAGKKGCTTPAIYQLLYNGHSNLKGNRSTIKILTVFSQPTLTEKGPQINTVSAMPLNVRTTFGYSNKDPCGVLHTGQIKTLTSRTIFQLPTSGQTFVCLLKILAEPERESLAVGVNIFQWKSIDIHIKTYNQLYLPRCTWDFSTSFSSLFN